jgi:GNAT superfamily N-acetyltransferase
MEIREATATDIQALLPLVDAYYTASPVAHTANHAAVAAHLQELVEPNNSLGGLLLATEDGAIAGFAFLYYGFNKRALKRTVILNDLFVDANYRRRGIARALIMATFQWGRAHGAVSVDWQTRVSNTGAQALYDQIGTRESGWIHYGHQL